MGSTGRTTNLLNASPTVVATPQQAASANNSKFSATDDGGYKDLYNGRQYYLDQTFSIDTRLALQDYLNPDPVAGSLYSPSQILNYAMENGQKLTPNQQYMVDSIMEGMHNIGYNTNLTHYGRVSLIDGFANNVGASINSNNFQNMTEAQLKQAFVGSQHSLNKFLSVSYNNFKNAPNGGAPFTDKAVKLNIKAPAKTQALMPGDATYINPSTGKRVRNQLGEMVMAPGQNIRITDVRFTGKNGRSGGRTYKQIEFDVEFY